MTYTVELVHKSTGRIDTVDRMTYNPMGMRYIQPLTVHLANATYIEDTVMLRVRGDFMGIPENDSSFEFNREMMYGTYPIEGDTVIAVGGGGIIAPDTTGCLQVIGPYPNPSHVNAQNVSILMSYCHAGQSVTVQVFDGLGNPIGDPVMITSDGHSWDRVQVPAPSTSGAYFIHVNAGFLSTTLPYSVTP